MQSIDQPTAIDSRQSVDFLMTTLKEAPHRHQKTRTSFINPELPGKSGYNDRFDRLICLANGVRWDPGDWTLTSHLTRV